MRNRFTWLVVFFAAGTICRAEPAVTGIRAIHRHGQTFVTWKDAAEGEEGARYRYTLYRSDQPITEQNIAGAQVRMKGVFNNSAKLFGAAFRQADRLDPAKPTCILEEGGAPLPMWSGLAVVTPEEDGAAHYAVAATDEAGKRVGAIVPGESATAQPVAEKTAPPQPIKLYDSKERGIYWQQTHISGKKDLPLFVSLHASNAGGGGAGSYGDYYLYFSRREWGYSEGLPGVFSVQERRDKLNRLVLDSRDTIVKPDGNSPMETYWFGYVCTPQWSDLKEPRAYPFTERRLDWIVKWSIEKYGADAERVYCSGGSMGAWGTVGYALRRPEIFAAVFPNRPRMIQKGMPSLAAVKNPAGVMMDDGKETYLDRMNAVKYVSGHHADLPFIGWCCGRHDGFASFREQIEMVQALTKSHHGFAFAWNNGDHSSGGGAMQRIDKHYPATKFARNLSYPAFGNSSIDDDLGTGEVEVKDGTRVKRVMEDGNGAPEGGINLGFDWKDVVDEADRWSVSLGNELAGEVMTVDVTPRRCQTFRPRPGDRFRWTDSAGGAGEASADEWGLVTVPQVRIKAGEQTRLTISRWRE